MEANTQKDKETCISTSRQHSHAPDTHFYATRHMLMH